MFGIHLDLHSYVYGLQRLMDRTDYDRIYPSHAEICVERDVIPGLIEGQSVFWQELQTVKQLRCTAKRFWHMMQNPTER